MVTKISETMTRYAAITGMSANCTDWMKSWPMPGHWNTVSVMIEKAISPPTWMPITVMTITGLQIGGLIAFAIITETVFQWPGMGLLFIQAVQFADIPVMAAYLCLIALIFVIINLVVDLLYFAVDPRLRVERTSLAH